METVTNSHRQLVFRRNAVTHTDKCKGFVACLTAHEVISDWLISTCDCVVIIVIVRRVLRFVSLLHRTVRHVCASIILNFTMFEQIAQGI